MWLLFYNKLYRDQDMIGLLFIGWNYLKIQVKFTFIDEIGIWNMDLEYIGKAAPWERSELSFFRKCTEYKVNAEVKAKIMMINEGFIF